MSSTSKDPDKILTLILTHKPKPLHMFIISLYNLPFKPNLVIITFIIIIITLIALLEL